MKKYLFWGIPLFVIMGLSGCHPTGEKATSLSIIYAAAAALSLLLLIGCCILVRKQRAWFILLFSSVFVVNVGYTFLSVSSHLQMALVANRVAYLGSVFLPFAMLMIILSVTNTQCKKWVPVSLLALAVVVFLIAASPGIWDIYYKEVSFQVINGVSTLVKVYGPLHPLYLLYLLGYFSAMVAVIIRASVREKIDTVSHAIMIAMAVFVNIGVWFIGQICNVTFEMLSISYIISELFLLGAHMVMNENQKLRKIVKQVEAVQSYSEEETAAAEVMLKKPIEEEVVSPERMEVFIAGLGQLTPTEHAVYDAYIARVTTKEIMANFKIKGSTLKYHNRNLYGKLGVSSRKELMEVHKYIKSVKAKLEGTGQTAGE